VVSQCWISFGVLSIILVDKMVVGEKFCFGCASRHEVCLPGIDSTLIFTSTRRKSISRKFPMVYLSIDCIKFVFKLTYFESLLSQPISGLVNAHISYLILYIHIL
jgi:hypothetical protein